MSWNHVITKHRLQIKAKPKVRIYGVYDTKTTTNSSIELPTEREREKRNGYIPWPHVHTTKTLQNTAKAIFRCCDPPQKQQLLQTQLFSAYSEEQTTPRQMAQ